MGSKEQKICEWAIPEDSIVVGAFEELLSDTNGNNTHNETYAKSKNNQGEIIYGLGLQNALY